MNILMADALSSDLSIGPGWGTFGNLPVGISYWILSNKPLLYLKCHVPKFLSLLALTDTYFKKCIQSEKNYWLFRDSHLKFVFLAFLFLALKWSIHEQQIELFMKEIMTFIKLHFWSLCTKALALFIICWTSSFPTSSVATMPLVLKEGFKNKDCTKLLLFCPVLVSRFIMLNFLYVLLYTKTLKFFHSILFKLKYDDACFEERIKNQDCTKTLEFFKVFQLILLAFFLQTSSYGCCA